MCGEDRSEKDREGSVVNISSIKAERAQREACKESIKITQKVKSCVKLGGKPDPRERRKSSPELHES